MHIKIRNSFNITGPNEHISQLFFIKVLTVIKVFTVSEHSESFSLFSSILVADWGLTPPPPRLRTGP